MRGRFCTREVPGRWSLQSFFDDCSHFQKKETYTGFTNGSKTITKTIICGIKNGLCETRPFFPFSSPFPLPFLSLSNPFPLPFLSLSSSFPLLSSPFSFPFLSLLLSFFLSFFFPFPFSFPIPFLVFSFRFPFPFSFSFPFPFPLPFLLFPFPSFVLPFPSPFARSCESFGQCVKPALGKTIRGKKTIMCEKKTFERARGFYQTPCGLGWVVAINGKIWLKYTNLVACEYFEDRHMLVYLAVYKWNTIISRMFLLDYEILTMGF